jgi:hypothetical protein
MTRIIFGVGLLALTLIISCLAAETGEVVGQCSARDANIDAQVRACR